MAGGEAGGGRRAMEPGQPPEGGDRTDKHRPGNPQSQVSLPPQLYKLCGLPMAVVDQSFKRRLGALSLPSIDASTATARR